MDMRKASENIFELEEELDLLDQKISDVHFWERVRFPVYQHLRRQSSSSKKGSEVADSGKYEEYLSGFQLLVRNILHRNPFLSDSSDLLFYGTGRRKKMDDNLWWDVYIDPIIEDIHNCDYIFLERPFNITHKTPAKTSELRYTDLIEYIGSILNETGINKISFSDSEQQCIETIKQELSTRFGEDIPIAEIIRDDLSLRRAKLPLYKRLISQIDPDVVVLVNSYGGRETFVEACQLEGVPVVELQHGVIDKFHMGYSFPNKKKNIFPDYFFSFGEYWSDIVDLPLPDENIYAVGYPHLEIESKKFDNVTEENQTVVISQPSIGDDLSRFAVRLQDHQGYDNKIVYKLHPKEYSNWQELYPWLAKSEVRCITNEIPLYELFAKSNTQVGVYSTALYEGLYFDLETYIIEFQGYEHMEDIIKRGHIVSVNSVSEFISTDTVQSDLTKQYFFEHNSVEKFKNSIKNIIQNCD